LSDLKGDILAQRVFAKGAFLKCTFPSSFFPIFFPEMYFYLNQRRSRFVGLLEGLGLDDNPGGVRLGRLG